MSDTTTQLNTLQPAEGSKHARRRVGRGIGSGLGKTGAEIARRRFPQGWF